MDTAPLIYFGTKDTRPPVRALPLRPMVLPQADGKMGHTDSGTEIELEASVLDQLSGDDIEILGPVPPELAFEI